MATLSVKQALAGGTPENETVEVHGWVRTRRDSKAGLSFVNLTDGSCFAPLQVVAPAALPNYANDVQRLSAGCAIMARGKLVPSQGKGQAFELQAD
ncbi:MAG TPA: OB-fold nucleic acid binding domain-containing protein, partial [Rhodanobacteraceae bacterium]|nr:OB-fold nucleic acid binding domain-containing protein [Rhodanobacteraceae bacterium]